MTLLKQFSNPNRLFLVKRNNMVYIFKHITFICIGISMVFIFSCCNDNPEKEGNNYLRGNPHHLIKNGNYYLKYERDEMNRITSYKEYDSDDSQNYFENDYTTGISSFTYDEDNRIISSESAGRCSVLRRNSDYYYSNNRLDSIISHQANWDFFWFHLTYDSDHSCGPSRARYLEERKNNGQLEIQIQHWEYSDQCDIFNYQEENFEFTSGSLEQEPIFHHEITFDSLENEWPIRRLHCNFHTLEYTHPKENNIVSYKIYDLNGNLHEDSYESDIEYFSNGRLKSEIRAYQSGTRDTFDFYYR